jgi:hypothetical protein
VALMRWEHGLAGQSRLRSRQFLRQSDWSAN